MLTPSLSAIIITHNEAHQIADCIASLRFCDEIIVVDNNSRDSTVEIAMSLGCKVVQTPDWPGFGKQKQRALDASTGNWILSVDADERVTPTLESEILLAINSQNFNGFKIKRRTMFLGRWMRYGGWYPDFVLRLAKRAHVRFDPTPVHEKMIVRGNIGTLRSDLLHYSYTDVSDVLTKQRRYALLGAQKKFLVARNLKVSVLFCIVRATWTFFRLFFLQTGFLDKRQGLIAAISKSQEVFWKYLAIEFQSRERDLK